MHFNRVVQVHYNRVTWHLSPEMRKRLRSSVEDAVNRLSKRKHMSSVFLIWALNSAFRGDLPLPSGTEWNTFYADALRCAVPPRISRRMRVLASSDLIAA